MKRSVLLIASLGLLLELIGFHNRPPESPALLFPLHGLIVLLGALLVPRTEIRMRVVPALLVLVGLSLSAVDLSRVLSMRHAVLDESSRRAIVERDAVAAAASFQEFLARERAVIESVPSAVFEETTDRWQVFAQLSSLRDASGGSRRDLTLTIYEAGGAALAWTGTPSVLEERELQAAVSGTIVQLVRHQPLGTRLLTVRALAAGGRCAVAESLLEAPYEPEAWRHRVALPSSMHSELVLELLEPRQADATLGEFFKEGGDRYWTRGSQEGSELLVPVRNASGAPLALMTLGSESAASAAARREITERVPPLLLLVAASVLLSVLALVAVRRFGPGLPEVSALAVLVVCLRIGALGLAPFLSSLSVFDYRLFSSPSPFHLLASPGDCLLTCLSALVLAGMLAAALRGTRGVFRASALAAALLLATGLVALTPSWVGDSSLNLARSPLIAPIAPRLCLGWSHAAIALAALLLAATAMLPRGRSIPLRLLAALWAVASVVSYLLLAKEAANIPAVLIEANLAPDVMKATEEGQDRLLRTMKISSDAARWDALELGDPTAIDRLAFEEWRASELGRGGLRSALAIMNSEGHILASFAYGLPDSVFTDIAGPAPPPLPPERGEPLLTKDDLTYLSLQVPLLRADVPLLRNGRPIGRLTALLSTEWDNLRFLTLSDPLLHTLGAGHQDIVFDEYFGGAPLFLAFSRTGEVLYPSAEQAAPLPARELPVRDTRWTVTRFARSPYRIYLFPTPEGPRAIGYVAPSILGLTAGLVRAAVGNLPLLVLLIGAVVFLRVPDLPRAFSLSTLGRFIAGSYYRRVLTVVLVSSLLPLLLLALTFRNVIERQAREAFEQEGIEAVGTMRRLLEDFVESREGQENRVPIRSKTLFWLGRTVHQDIHVFIEDRLVATSRGDLEASGLRGFRLNAEVAREIARNRPPQILLEEKRPGRGGALVYAPVRLREGWPDTVLAAPLLVQDRVVGRAAETVSDALLTATFGLGIVLSGVGYLFARRLSIPIRELGEAARRIAEGRLEVRVRPRGRDEIRSLVDAFNGMAVALGEQREDLRRRKDYIETILLNVTTGVISTSADGLVRTSNPAASLLLDLPADMTGRSLFEEMGRRPELAALREVWSRSLHSSTPQEIGLVREFQEVRLRSVVLPLAESPEMPAGRIFLVEDVTDVMRSNRLAAWAEMARRIAHEIKNPLTPIQLSAEHLLRVRGDGRADFDRVLRECVGTILDQVRALRDISSDFSTYSRLPDLRREPSDLAGLVRSTIAPYRLAPPEGIRVEEEIEPLPSALLDTRVLRRALVNLVENAFQAMDGGGVLRVSVRLRGNRPDRHAEVVVADTGPGMDEATLARVFEPYFSTRDAGIGLGLAIARRAVEEHGGTLAAESVPGRGTRMIIRLPLDSDPGTGAPPDQGSLPPIPGNAAGDGEGGAASA